MNEVEDFFRNWNDYKYGFGNKMGEYRLGTVTLWILKRVSNNMVYEKFYIMLLILDLFLFYGNHRIIKNSSARFLRTANRFGWL